MNQEKKHEDAVERQLQGMGGGGDFGGTQLNNPAKAFHSDDYLRFFTVHLFETVSQIVEPSVRRRLDWTHNPVLPTQCGRGRLPG